VVNECCVVSVRVIIVGCESDFESTLRLCMLASSCPNTIADSTSRLMISHTHTYVIWSVIAFFVPIRCLLRLLCFGSFVLASVVAVTTTVR